MLLVIVISIVGGVFIWLRGTFGSLQATVGNQTTRQAEQMGQEVVIQSVDCSGNNVYVQSTGTSDISSANVYVDGAPCGATGQAISVDETVSFSCTLSGGITVKATTESGANDQVTESCP